MIHISFTVPGLAVGKQERATTRRRRDGTVYPTIYTERKSRAFMAEVAAQAQLEVLESKLADLLPTDEPLAMEIVFFIPRLPSEPKSRKFPIRKPDIKNVYAGVEDALHGILFRNDSHVVDAHICRRYCPDGMEPHTSVEVWVAGTKRYDTKP